MSATWARLYQGELKEGALRPLSPACPDSQAGFAPAAFWGPKDKVGRWGPRSGHRCSGSFSTPVPENSSVTPSAFRLLSPDEAYWGGFLYALWLVLRPFSMGCCVSPLPPKSLSAKVKWEFDGPLKETTCIVWSWIHRKSSGLPCHLFLFEFSFSLQNSVLCLITSSDRNNVFTYAWSLNKPHESEQFWSGKLHLMHLTSREPACLEQDEHTRQIIRPSSI